MLNHVYQFRRVDNSTVLVLVNGKKFELTRTRTRNSNSTVLNPRDIEAYSLYRATLC